MNKNARELLDNAIALREDGREKQDSAILNHALNLLLNLSENDPENAEINYQIGIAYDNSGLCNKAIPYYVKAIEQGLSDSDLQRCFLGLGSSYRILGHYKEAVDILHRGVSEFPEHRALQVFYSMALYNTGEYKRAMEIILMNLMETTNDEILQYYKRGISYYAQHLDETLDLDIP